MATTKKFLDSAGVTHLWSKIKEQDALKADLSDFTALQTLVGTLPASAGTATTFADWIAAVALAAGDATAIEAIDDRVEAIENDYLTSTEQQALQEQIDDNKEDITVLKGADTVAGSVAKSIKDAMTAEVTRADAAYSDKAYEAKVNTLIGSDTNKSARTIASEEVAKIVNGANASYDTLKEIADWIIAHPNDAATYNTRITANETKLAGISTTVVAYVTDAISTLAAQADLTALTTRVTTAETDVTNLKALHASGSHNGKSTVAEEVAAAVSDLDLSNTYQSKTVGDADHAAIQTLNGNASTAGSVAKSVADAIAAEVTRANAAYDAKDSAAAVLGTSADTATSNTVYGAKKYADSLAANYATAAQGALADTALQEADVIALTAAEINAAIAAAV